MNAWERVKRLTVRSKIEAIVYIFRDEFSECLADLKPEVKSHETEKFRDIHSIDIGFYFSHPHSSCGCRRILMQVRVARNAELEEDQALGIDLSGYELEQEQWQFSTMRCWQFSGASQPTSEAQTRLKQVCSEILKLFDSAQSVDEEF